MTDLSWLKAQTQGLERRLAVLVEEHKALQAAYDALQQEAQAQATRLEQQKAEIQKLQQRAQANTFAKGLPPMAASVEQRALIEKHIRQLDACIAFLNR